MGHPYLLKCPFSSFLNPKPSCSRHAHGLCKKMKLKNRSVKIYEQKHDSEPFFGKLQIKNDNRRKNKKRLHNQFFVVVKTVIEYKKSSMRCCKPGRI